MRKHKTRKASDTHEFGLVNSARQLQPSNGGCSVYWSLIAVQRSLYGVDGGGGGGKSMTSTAARMYQPLW